MSGEGHLEGRSYPHARLVELRIPESLATEALDRARERSDRFEVDGDEITIWPSGRSQDGNPMGSITLRHRAPEVGWALVYDLHWNPAHGGSEAGVREAANELIGSELL